MTTDLRHASSVGREVIVGAAAGVVAALVMGGYAMLAYLLSDKGLFTPLHQLATLFLSPDAMESSMASARDGEPYDLAVDAAVVGAALHLALGAVYGAIFGALVGRHKLEAMVLAVAGLAFGLIVMVVNAFAFLPLSASIFDVPDIVGGNPIADFPHFTSWGHFFIEHLLFGLVLGAMVTRLTPSETPPDVP